MAQKQRGSIKPKLKHRAMLLVTVAGVIAFAMLAYVFQQRKEIFAPTRLDLLVMRLEGNYRRHLDVNKYSINFKAKPPNTVVILVKHYNDVNRNNMNAAVESVRSTIKGLASENYELPFLDVQTEITQVGRDDVSEPETIWK